MNHDAKREEGISSVGILVAVVIVVTLGLGGFGVWSYTNYLDQKNNTDAKISTAVTAAKKTQTETDKVNFDEQEKLPNQTFEGPGDLGSVTFDYPKTWSTYVGNAGATGTFNAYLNPKTVPTVAEAQQYALRVSVESRDYESTLKIYESLVKKGTVKSTIITTNELSGTRLEGQFSKTIDGTAVIFKVRDKTLTIRTDSPTFEKDFNETIIPSLRFTP